MKDGGIFCTSFDFVNKNILLDNDLRELQTGTSLAHLK